MMTLGYQRTLQATDLWKMDPSRESSLLSNKFDESWVRRCKAAAEWNARLDKGEISPFLYLKTLWGVKSFVGGPSVQQQTINWQQKDGRKEASIARALNDVLGREFWAGGIFKVFGDVSQLMGPLVVKVRRIFISTDRIAFEACLLTIRIIFRSLILLDWLIGYRLSSNIAPKEHRQKPQDNQVLISGEV
jgi:hypothetical protein